MTDYRYIQSVLAPSGQKPHLDFLVGHRLTNKNDFQQRQ
jgi:hypothetical protein